MKNRALVTDLFNVQSHFFAAIGIRIWDRWELSFDFIFSGQLGDPPLVSKEQLASLQQKFTQNGTTFVKCSYLQKLIINGEDEEILRRRKEISRSLLLHACEYKKDKTLVTKVTILAAL